MGTPIKTVDGRTDTEQQNFSRRSVLKAAGAAGVAVLLPFSGMAATADTSTIDDSFDLSSDAPQEVIVVFDSIESVERLSTLDLVKSFYAYNELPMAYTALTGDRSEPSWAGRKSVG